MAEVSDPETHCHPQSVSPQPADRLRERGARSLTDAELLSVAGGLDLDQAHLLLEKSKGREGLRQSLQTPGVLVGWQSETESRIRAVLELATRAAISKIIRSPLLNRQSAVLLQPCTRPYTFVVSSSPFGTSLRIIALHGVSTKSGQGHVIAHRGVVLAVAPAALRFWSPTSITAYRGEGAAAGAGAGSLAKRRQIGQAPTFSRPRNFAAPHSGVLGRCLGWPEL